MEKEFRAWDNDLINFKTTSNQVRIEELKKKLEYYDDDPFNKKRTSERECKVCTYINDNFAGQAFTDSYCGICGKKMTFPTTDTDKVCKECAKENGLCKHCGGRMD
jgi:NADH pyrophosphatase NudC (nudix superfamily)